MELTFLGTGSAYPTPTRGVSCVIFRNEGTYWMFDCGEGSQIQLMRSSVRPGKISKIFISHLHGDHMFGLPGLMCTISQNFCPENKDPVELYGPVGLRKFVRVSLELSRSQLGFDYIVHELVPQEGQQNMEYLTWEVDHTVDDRLHPNERPGRTIDNDNGVWHLFENTETLSVKAGALCHRIPSFGFVIEESATPGKLNMQALKTKGIQPGPICAKLKQGHTVTSPSGEQVHADEVLGPPRPGRRVVILGDTSDSSQMAALCRGADLVVHEATLENEMKEKAIEKGHSTPGMAGSFCKEILAQQLILTHFSQRYKPLSAEIKEGDVTMEKLLKQAKEAFNSDNVIAAEDLLTVNIQQKKIER